MQGSVAVAPDKWDNMSDLPARPGWWGSGAPESSVLPSLLFLSCTFINFYFFPFLFGALVGLPLGRSSENQRSTVGMCSVGMRISSPGQSFYSFIILASFIPWLFPP